MDGSALGLPRGGPQSLGSHTAATLRLAAPLAAAQLAQMAMGVTDTVLLGALGPEALAAGGLAASVMMSVMVVLQGVLAAVSILVAQARGAGNTAIVPALYWTAVLLAAMLAIPAFALFSLVGALLGALGEPARLTADTQAYLDVLRWGVPGAMLGMGLLRAFLPAIGGGPLLLWVSAGEAIVNAPLCYGLIHGAWGLPALGLEGAALATVIVLTAGSLVLLLLLHTRPAFRPLVAPARPQPGPFGTMLKLGIPIGATFAVETSLFLAVALLIGLLGPAPLAAQHVTLNTVALAFMVAVGIAQAANVRVGMHVGARDMPGARRAGLVAIALAAAWEAAAALVLVFAPEAVVGLYLDPADAEAFTTAIALLQIVVLFQVADGVQAAAAGALRGLGDTRVPFLLATIGYWAIGFPAAWLLTLRLGFGAPGAWWGLAAGLIVVAALLLRRFLVMSRRTPQET